MIATGSEIGRLLACPTSAVLPRADEANEYSDEGEARHLEAEVAAELGDLDALPPRIAALLRGATAVMTELAVVYDAATDTARTTPWIKGRAYHELDLGPFEIPMTIDLGAFFDEPRRIVVVDHKLYAAQGRPKEHGQLMTCALALARAYDVEDATIAISYLGTGWADIAQIDIFDLADHAERLQQLHLRVAEARRTPAPRRGPHCHHCPAFHGCPAWSAMIERAGSGETALDVERAIPFERDEAAQWGLDLLASIELMYKRLKAAIYARAKERPIPLRDGKVFGPRTKPGHERLDGPTVYAVAAEIYGREAAREFVEMEATKKQIGEAIGKRAARGQKTHDVDALLKEVRRRGGATRKNTTSYEAYDPAQVPPAAAPAALPAPAAPEEGDDGE